MWRSRFFWRMFGAYSVLFFVAFVFLGWLLIERIEKHLLRDKQNTLELKSSLVRDLVNRFTEAELQSQTSRLAGDINARITLIRADGVVIAESAEQLEKLDNHGYRVEVAQSESTGIAFSTRYSVTVHQPMMYVSRRNEQGPVRYVRIGMPLDSIAEEIRWLYRQLWSVASITLAFALLISLLISRRISAPLVALSAAADSIARGEYGRKVMIQSSDEMGVLAASFNSMSVACAAQIAQMNQDREQLRTIFRSMAEGVLVLDAQQTILFANEAASQLLGMPIASAQGRKIWQVFRHRRLNDAVEKVLTSDEPYRCDLEWVGSERRDLALQAARLPGEPIRGAVLVFHDITHLRKLETVRQDFVANVSHELKTPLAAIQAMVETLLDGALQDAEHNVKFLERIRENADRLHRLIQDLLTLGRIESSQAPLEIEPILLDSALEAIMSRHEDRMKANHQHFVYDKPPHPVTALADHEALSAIIDNLVDNAIKYTPVSGTITLRWRATENEAVLQVADTGVGIPDKDLPRVFERFYRVDKARSRELGGTGLGLSIVKHLVQTLAGSITAESKLGEGTTFTVRLPLVKA